MGLWLVLERIGYTFIYAVSVVIESLLHSELSFVTYILHRHYYNLCMSLHLPKAYCNKAQRPKKNQKKNIQCQEMTCILCAIRPFLKNLRTMATTTSRVWTARGLKQNCNMIGMEGHCWTAAALCLPFFQTVPSPRCWSFWWSRVWPSMDHSPSSQQRGAKWAGCKVWRKVSTQSGAID